MYNNSLAILIISCDKYSDLWDPFFQMFNIFWPNCEYPIYMGSNTVICKEKGVKTICIGEDKSWAENVKAMIAQIPESHILMLLEDFFLQAPVDQEGLEKVYRFMLTQDIDCLRVCPDPAPGKTINKELKLGIISTGAPYCCSTQPAIWKKAALVQLLHDGYSAWDFEKKNSMTLKNTNMKFVGSNKWYVNRHNGVERGKWYTSTLKLLKENSVEVDPTARGIIDNLTVRRRIYHHFYRSVQYLRAKLHRV